MLYVMGPDSLEAVPETNFAQENVLERQDLQRLLRTRIEVIGDDLMVIAEEFASFVDANRRIDLLCLSKSGQLVVLELKRTSGGGHMELQALRYAAFVSTMTLEQVIEAHESFCRITGVADPETAEERINDFLGDALEDASLGRDVRIVLVSADFARELAATVLWLNRFPGMDIRCVRLRPHRLGEQVILDVQQILPLPEASEYEVRVKNKEVEVAHSAGGSDSKDYTKFVVHAPSGSTPPLAKRNAMLAMVRALLEQAGLPPQQLVSVLSAGRWFQLPGRLEGEAVAAALLERNVQLKRAFWQHPFYDAESTWVLRNQWGLNTATYLEELSALAPGAGIWAEAIEPGQ